MARERYEGLNGGSYGERAVREVMECEGKRLLEPVLASRLGLAVEAMAKLVKRAVDLGYIAIEQPEGDAWPKGTKMYVPGRKFALEAAEGKVTAEGIPVIGDFPRRQKDRPLNPKHFVARPMGREGAWDFLNIPSLYPTQGA